MARRCELTGKGVQEECQVCSFLLGYRIANGYLHMLNYVRELKRRLFRSCWLKTLYCFLDFTLGLILDPPTLMAQISLIRARITGTLAWLAGSPGI